MHSLDAVSERVLEANLIHTVLTDPASPGVLITGSPGIGKQELVESVLSLDRGHTPVVRLLCSPTLLGTSFGALAPMLSGNQSEPSDVEALRQVIRAVRNILQENVDGMRLLILVEEAQFIDSASAFVLGQLVHSGLAKLVVLSTEKHLDALSLDALKNGALLQRVQLGSLGVSETQQLCARILPGPVTTGTARIIWEQTNGNPFLVRCFVEGAQRQGLFAEQCGKWALNKIAPEPDDRLREAIRDLHRRHPADEQEALELLSLAGPVSSQILVTITGIELENNNSSSLIRVNTESATASAASSFYATILRSTIPPGRNLSLRQKYLVSNNSGNESGFEEVRWAIDSGESPEPGVVLRAARTANDQAFYDVAWKLAQMVPVDSASPDMLIERARALFGKAKALDSPQLMASAILPVSDGKQAGIFDQARKIAHWIHTGDMDPDYFHAEHQENCADFTIIKQIIDARNHFDTGEIEKAAELVAEVTAMDLRVRFQPIRYRLSLAVIEARARTAMGDYEQALDGIQGFQFSNSLEVFYANGSLRFCQALNELHQGKMREARITITEAVSELYVGDPEGLLDLALALNDYLDSVHRKNSGPVESAAAPGKPMVNRVRKRARGYWPERDCGLSNIYRELSLGSPRISMLQTSLDALALQPNRVAEREALFLCWSTGISKDFSDAVGNRFLAGQRRQPGKREEFQGRLVEQARSGLVVELEQLAASAHANNEMVCAMETVARIVVLLGNTGLERQQGLYLRQLDEWLGVIGGLPWGIVGDTLTARGLTLREREIVDLARSGLSNREIAKELTVSQRTVEGHLYRIFSKLGMRTRKELSEVASQKSRNSATLAKD